MKEAEMIEERESDKIYVRWMAYFIVFLAVIMTINITASYAAKDFGMTPPDLMSEFFLVSLYLTAGSAIFLITGRISKIKSLARFSVRTIIVILTFTICYGQITVSHELAPVKIKFAKAAGTCYVKPDGQLKCGEKVKEVIAERQAVLAKLNAIAANDWSISVSRIMTLTKTSSIYFATPF